MRVSRVRKRTGGVREGAMRGIRGHDGWAQEGAMGGRKRAQPGCVEGGRPGGDAARTGQACGLKCRLMQIFNLPA